jgi:hypothetical protein
MKLYLHSHMRPHGVVIEHKEILRVSVTNPGPFYLRRPPPGRIINTCKIKLRGLSPRANYTDRATAACRRS